MEKKYMEKALELAKKGWGMTNPNPLVGAVIVKNDRVIAQGYHRKLGSNHAEIDALNNTTENVMGATMYVNLEPCSHHGRTPPCAEAIIKSGIKKVFVAMEDPNPLVSGKGIRMLNEAGIETVIGILESEARKLNEIFIKYIVCKSPFVIIKTAMSLDGKIATYGGDSKWITCETSRNHVHTIRDRVAAIMVGINTVIKDDPLLTTRIPSQKGNDPIRIIVDSKGLLPPESRVINTLSPAKVILATTSAINSEREKILSNKGVKILKIQELDGHVDLNMLINELYKMNIDSVLIEGGGGLNAAALDAGIADKIMTFIAPKIIGGRDALSPFEGKGICKVENAINLNDVSFRESGEDFLIEGYLKGNLCLQE